MENKLCLFAVLFAVLGVCISVVNFCFPDNAMVSSLSATTVGIAILFVVILLIVRMFDK